MTSINILVVAQGWVSQPIFRVELSPNHFVGASSRVRSSQVRSAIFTFTVYFIKNINNKLSLYDIWVVVFTYKKERSEQIWTNYY